MDALYAFTDCEVSIVPSLIVIKDSMPVRMTVEEVLSRNTERLKEMLERELRIERGRLQDRPPCPPPLEQDLLLKNGCTNQIRRDLTRQREMLENTVNRPAGPWETRFRRKPVVSRKGFQQGQRIFPSGLPGDSRHSPRIFPL